MSVWLSCGGSSAFTREDASGFEALRAEYRSKEQRLSQPLVALKQQYASVLGKLRAAAQTAGELEEVILILKEQKGFEQGDHVEATGKLATQQEIYFRERKRLQGIEDRGMQALQGKYLAALEQLRAKLTRERRIDDAVLVQNELRKARAEAEERARRIAEAHLPPLRDLAKLKPKEIDGEPSFLSRYERDTPVFVDGRKYPRSKRIFAHAPATLTWKFDSPVSTFTSLVTVMYNGVKADHHEGKVVFRILSGERVLFKSKPVRMGEHDLIDIEFEPTSTLTLVTDTAGSGDSDHAFWVQPKAR